MHDAHAFVRSALDALILSLVSSPALAQVTPHGGMLRYPDVNASHIVFVYGDDLWLVPREGGVASPLASPPGLEALPRFSPDGKTIAFIGNYDGNKDLYTIPVTGGVPMRVTHHPATEVLSDWTPDGNLLFFTNGLAGRDRQMQMFTVAPGGGLPAKVGIPYGAFGAINSTGEWLAYTPHTTDNRTWKRYRGGMATDIWLYNLKTHAARRATDWEGTDTQPMWRGGTLYYLSDEGPSHRENIWTLDPGTSKRRQITRYADFDVKWPAIGPGPKGDGEIVFQHGAELVLLDLAKEVAHAVEVIIPGARPTLRERAVDAAKLITSWKLSPSGKRAVVEARGDVWTLPVKNGSPRNLTRTSGVAERYPAPSPDGKWIAYFSDATGEYELHLAPADGKGEVKRLTHGGSAWRAGTCWSPDSKRIAFFDKSGSLFVQPVDGSAPTLVDKDPWAGDLLPYEPSWSHDGRFLAFARNEEDDVVTSAIWIHEIETGAKHKVTAGMFRDSQPTFDRMGDYLYFKSSRSFTPLYGEVDLSFLYAGTEVLLSVPLRTDMKSPFAPKSDEEVVKTETKEGDKKGSDENDEEKSDEQDKKDKGKKDSGKKDGGAKDKADESEDKKPREKVEIAFEGFERRAIPLPVDPGLFGAMAVNDKGALIYARLPIQGSDDKPSIHIFDVSDEKNGEDAKDGDDSKEKTVAEDAGTFSISADGKKLIVTREKGTAILDTKAEAEEEAISTEGMSAMIDPRAEWRQLFDDAWRLERDWFYDPHMHGVSWAKVKDDYAAMLADCVTREDVSFVIREMISELNVGHAYYSGGDTGDEPKVKTGLLGCDFELDGGAYRIARIHEGAPWDSDARGPLSQPGVDVHVGDFLLAVNGTPLDVHKDPWAAFQNLAGRAITLTVSSKPQWDDGARDVVVKALDSERELRYRAWIERSRAYVDTKTNGKVGYVYVQSTGTDGQSDLVRQLQGQMGKSALIIDERWNSGGQIPTRFIELLNRPITNYWARREARDWAWPPDGHRGPKCMLINGLSGSGGDAFPAYFRLANLGKLIGTRTWGGLIGLSGNPNLIDGAEVTVPTFGYYDKDGTWGIEGHGVDPDIEVIDDPSRMADGGDPQLDAAIALMQSEIERNPYTPPGRPPWPDRSGMGIAPSDK